MFEDFKEFVKRGNVVDMAVGIIIGAAFTTVVQSLVNDIIMPPIGLLTGGADFADLFITLGGGSYDSLVEAEAAGAATINYGLFLNNLIIFLIVAFAVFMLVRAYRELIEREEVKEEVAEEVTTKKCPQCLSDIPKEAIRCAHCTVLLEHVPAPAADM